MFESVLFKNQVDFDKLFAGVPDLVIDVTEVPVEQAGNHQLQEDAYSGKKIHTLKWLLVSTLNKRILFVSKAYGGHTHDFIIFKDVFATLDLSAYRLHVDAEFVGIKKITTYKKVWIPYKASKNHPLTKIQKAIDYLFAHVRVAVENKIAKVKAFFILRIENWLRIKSKLEDAFQICTVLANSKTTYMQTKYW